MTLDERIEALASYGARIRAQFAPKSDFMRRLNAQRRRWRTENRKKGVWQPFDAVGFAVMWGYRPVFAPGDVKVLYGLSFSRFFVGFLFEELTDVSPPVAEE